MIKSSGRPDNGGILVSYAVFQIASSNITPQAI